MLTFFCLLVVGVRWEVSRAAEEWAEIKMRAIWRQIQTGLCPSPGQRVRLSPCTERIQRVFTVAHRLLWRRLLGRLPLSPINQLEQPPSPLLPFHLWWEVEEWLGAVLERGPVGACEEESNTKFIMLSKRLFGNVFSDVFNISVPSCSWHAFSLSWYPH